MKAVHMSRIGVIGTGSMGGMLIRKFVETGAFSAGDIVASNRSPEKVRAVAMATGIEIATNNLDLAAASDVIHLRQAARSKAPVERDRGRVDGR
jgi:competence protein ComER